MVMKSKAGASGKLTMHVQIIKTLIYLATAPGLSKFKLKEYGCPAVMS